MRFVFRSGLLFLIVALSACTSAETNPPRSATEQMLISTAADRAADQLVLGIPQKTPVFVDASNFEGYDSKYAVAALHASLLKQGARLVDDKKKAKVILEVRAGALSTDKRDTLIGTPSFTIPIPFAASGVEFPQIALYKSSTQQGVAKFASAAYDAKSGSMVQVDEPFYGLAHRTRYTVLLFFSWTENEAVPEDHHDIVVQKGREQLFSSKGKKKNPKP